MKIRNMLLIVAIMLLVAFVFVVPALAQAADPPVAPVAATTSPPVQSQAEFIAFVVLITGFFKQQFGLEGKWILGVGFLIALVLWFLPDIEALLPTAAVWIDKFVELVKLFLASAGAFDTVVNVGSKIATASITKAGNLSTSEVK